jgi:hypothetical protein
MKKHLPLTLWKIACIFSFLLGEIVYARTEYKSLEKSVDLHIFSEYADFLSTVKNPYALFSRVSIRDKAWSTISNQHNNTISNVYYSKKGYLVMENKKYDFEINIKPTVNEKSIIWKCKFIDNKVVFDFTCLGWEKETFYVIPNK